MHHDTVSTSLSRTLSGQASFPSLLIYVSLQEDEGASLRHVQDRSHPFRQKACRVLSQIYILITSRQRALYLFAANYLNISLIYSAITMFLHENYSLSASPWKYDNAG